MFKKRRYLYLLFMGLMTFVTVNTPLFAANGFITGRVYEADGTTPITVDAWVEAVDTNTGQFIGSVDTLSDGTYIAALPPGEYYIAAAGFNRTREYYDNAGEKTLTATPVTITSEATVSNIDFSLNLAGTISGTVRDSNNNPIPDINVGLDDYWLGACSDENGEFTVYQVPLTTPVTIFASAYENNCDGSELYLPEWWQEQPDRENATPITLSSEGENVSGINFTLDQGGTVQGTVYESDGSTPVQVNARVEAFAPITDEFIGSTGVKNDGTYELALEPGDYVIRAAGESRAIEYYNDAGLTVQNADVVTVTQGAATSNINFTLDAAGFITGVVQDTNNNPLANMNVFFADYPIGTCTDTNGNFTLENIPLNAPSAVGAGGDNWCGGSTFYGVEFWEEVTSPENAVPVSVSSEGETYSGIVFTLEAGGSLSGQFTAAEDNSPLAGIGVCAFPYANTIFDGFHCTDTRPDGTYSIGGLSGGDYRVWTFPEDRLRLFYNNANSFEAASPVTVTIEEDTPNINFSLPQASIISGLITDTENNPLNGIDVWVQPALGDGDHLYPECSSVPNGGADGRYNLYVPAGTWYVYASSEGPCGLPNFATLVHPNPVTVAVGQTINDINFQIPELYAFDVNKDNRITPSDVIYVINRIDSEDLTTDVNGDGFVTELDAELVIGQLGQVIIPE